MTDEHAEPRVTGPGDETGRLRSRLERGEWRALVEPAAEGLLMMALLDAVTWWPDAWVACLAAMLLERRWPRHDPRGEGYQQQRMRWRVGLAPGYMLDEAQGALLRGGGRDMDEALAVLARWPA